MEDVASIKPKVVTNKKLCWRFWVEKDTLVIKNSIKKKVKRNKRRLEQLNFIFLIKGIKVAMIRPRNKKQVSLKKWLYKYKSNLLPKIMAMIKPKPKLKRNLICLRGWVILVNISSYKLKVIANIEPLIPGRILAKPIIKPLIIKIIDTLTTSKLY